MSKRRALLGFAFGLFCCTLAVASNVLVVVLDDVGEDMFGVYRSNLGSPCAVGDLTDCPPTPTIDKLAKSGVTFLNYWTNPICAATRSTITFGRYGLRTGVVGPIGFPPDSELAVPEILPLTFAPGVSTAMIGKWGLGNNGGPAAHGFGYEATSNGGAAFIPNYCDWSKGERGTFTPTHTYATTENVRDAIAWIQEQGSQPWFLHLAFNAAHDPFHVPPDYGACPDVPLHSYSSFFPEPLPDQITQCENPPGSISACPQGFESLCYRAMLQAADTELGCLLSSINPKVLSATTIIIVGDNGTPPGIDDPLAGPGRVKFSVSRGGIQVPLIVSGEQVKDPGTTSDTLVNASDIFATTTEILTGGPFSNFAPDKIYDSTSFLPTLNAVCSAERNWIFSQGQPVWRAIRDPHYKLMRKLGSPTCTVFYDLSTDPLERCPLVRDGTGCGAESAYIGPCDIPPPPCTGLCPAEPFQDPCNQYPDCVRLRDEITALIATAPQIEVDESVCEHEGNQGCVPGTSFCADAGIRCSFDGTCGLSGFCNSTCVSDKECTEPDSLFPTEVGLVQHCSGG